MRYVLVRDMDSHRYMIPVSLYSEWKRLDRILWRNFYSGDDSDEFNDKRMNAVNEFLDLFSEYELSGGFEGNYSFENPQELNEGKNNEN